MDEEIYRECRRCLLLQSGQQELLRDIKDRIVKIPAKEKTDDGAYERRLSLCAGCDHLVSGTCLKCGCYPEFRAAFAKNRCPIKKW